MRQAPTLAEAINNKPCIGCERIEKSIHFMVQSGEGLGTRWDKVDVCEDCAGRLTAEDLHQLVVMREDAA